MPISELIILYKYQGVFLHASGPLPSLNILVTLPTLSTITCIECLKELFSRQV